MKKKKKSFGKSNMKLSLTKETIQDFDNMDINERRTDPPGDWPTFNDPPLTKSCVVCAPSCSCSVVTI